jgi:hypothetical protein
LAEHGVGVGILDPADDFDLSAWISTSGPCPGTRHQLAVLERDAMAFTLTELQRMEGVIDRFVLYRRLAKGLLIGGFILAALGARRRRRLLALGSGLALQGGLTLVLDTLARSRALDYYRALGLHRFSLSGLLE